MFYTEKQYSDEIHSLKQWILHSWLFSKVRRSTTKKKKKHKSAQRIHLIAVILHALQECGKSGPCAIGKTKYKYEYKCGAKIEIAKCGKRSSSFNPEPLPGVFC